MLNGGWGTVGVCYGRQRLGGSVGRFVSGGLVRAAFPWESWESATVSEK